MRRRDFKFFKHSAMRHHGLGRHYLCVPCWASPSSCARVHYYIYEGVGGEDAPRVFACFPKQVVLLFNLTCFPWQNNLFSSAKQVVFFGEITCFDIRARYPVSSSVGIYRITRFLAAWRAVSRYTKSDKSRNGICRFHVLRRQDSNMRPPGYEPGELPTAPLRDVSFNPFPNCECKGTTIF